MKAQLLRPLLFLSLIPLGFGAALPPEKLCPSDTLVVLTIPDCAKASRLFEQSRYGQLWRDPELKAFRDRLVVQVRTDILNPLEVELGVKLGDWAELAQGQLTLAMMPGARAGQTNASPGWLVLLDVRDRSEQLRQRLSDLRRKWVEAGKQIKTDRIRDVEFSTLILGQADLSSTLQKLFPQGSKGQTTSPKPDGVSSRKTEFLLGQSDSLLILATSPKDVERILIRQAQGSVPPLAELPGYEAVHNSLFRDACAFGFVNFQSVGEMLAREAAEASTPGRNRQALIRPDKVIDATGLRGLKMIACALKDTADGLMWQFSARVPEADRRGLFKVLAVQAKESEPPSFVPAEVVKFSRWRLDGAQAWAAMETMIGEISPQMSGVLRMLIGSVGKDKDPDFDFRKSFVGNLGDDLITFQRGPRSATLADLDSPPTLVLVGSPNADQLLSALRTGSSLLPAEPESLKERDFLGRKIYSLPMPTPALPGGVPATERSVQFAASGGYVAVSTDAAMLEDYLRAGEAKVKNLRETTGFKEAADRVGGMSTGLFGYENNREKVRTMLEVLKQGPDAVLVMIPAEYFLVLKESGLAGPLQSLLSACDFALLPAFEKVSRYFDFSVSAGAVTADGIDLKVFAPTPPGLKK